MARITNADQIALAMQARLQRLKKSGKAERTPATDKSETSGSMKADNLEMIMSQPEIDEETLTRQLISHILADEIGEDIVADHRFTKIVAQVATIIRNDETSLSLLRDAMSDLRND